ncbi:MAG: hypothetical protein GEU88_05255 [Solirubrobacterales bacterium]|nr:hypothetical protein [Solirubrobacterales bacterium]
MALASDARGSRGPPVSSPPAVGIGIRRSLAWFLACAGTLITAGGIVAAVNSAVPFERGSWLAAYLVLVGGVSQVILGAGGLALHACEPRERLIARQLALWNLGSLAVPLGVLTDAAAVVSAGSAALLAALALFAAGARTTKGRETAPLVGYYAAILALGASVVVGSALADAPPGGWI